MKKILIKHAKAIVSCDSRDTVYENCDLLIFGERIEAIGPNLVCDEAEVIDATDKFVYPGLISTHHHFFQTFVRNLVTIDYPNMTVPQWLDVFFQTVKHIDLDATYYSSLVAMADMIKHGCTTAFDHSYAYTPATGLEVCDRQMDAAELMGMRFVAGRACNTRPMRDGSPIPDTMLETTEGFISDCKRLIKTYHDDQPYSMRQIVIAPCSPMNSYAETFVESVKLAKETGCRLHTHVGEGDNAVVEARTGMRTFEWLRSLGFYGENTWYAHCWEETDEEFKIMGATGTGVAHCPGPAVVGAFPILPMKDMLAYDVPLGIGCDGCATNDSSSMLDSLRMAFLMQCYFGKERGGAISAYEILKIATAGSARVLGRSDIGTLEAGKAADLFMVDSMALEYVGAGHDPKNMLARIGVESDVWLTMINGKVVFKNHMLLNVDEAVLAKKAYEAQQKAFVSQCDAFKRLH